MIKANELRIGNWVKNDCDDTLFQVTANDILTCEKDPGWLLPIPINDIMLCQLGFSMSNFGDLDEPEPVSVWIGQGTWVEYQVKDYARILANQQPKYLHQLQNLIYAITGLELVTTVWENKEVNQTLIKKL